MRRAAGGALALLAVGWAASVWVEPFSDERVNDLFVYRQFAGPVLGGALPYRDVFLEYPPLAAPAIALPGLAGTEESIFRAAFAGWTLLLAAATVLLCGALAVRTGGAPRRALYAAALMPLALGAVGRTHFDLAAVALLLGALLLLLDRRPRSGMALLGLAAMTKGFPIVAAPAALAWIAARHDGRTMRQAGGALAAALIVPALVAAALSPSGALEAVEYHLERPVQVESVPATGVLALDALGAGEAQSVQSHRSDGLEHPAAGPLAALALLVMLAAVAVCAARAAGEPRRLLLAALTAVLAFAALGKVLSPQYMLWLVPLGALAFAWRMHALTGAIAAAAVLTQLEFPARYFDVVARDGGALALVTLRNLALVAALALALRELLRGRQQHLLDRRGPPARVALDDDRVEPRVLV